MFEKNIDISKNALRENKIPLLHTDPNWLKLFGDVKDRNIKKMKEDLVNKIDEEKEIKKQVKTFKRQKIKCMKMILGVSDSINNEHKKENIKLLDEYKNKIESINVELEDLTFKLENMPKEIRKINADLLNATIQYGYGELKNKEQVLKDSIEEIDLLRSKLQELINIKHDYEEWINCTYTFFHGLLGSEIIEKIDKERLR